MTVQAVKFSNEKIRPAADRLAQLYNFANTVIDEWNALEGIKLIPNNSEVIADNAENDGRTIITGADANNVIDRLQEFVNDMNANTSEKLNTVLKPAVNTVR